MRSGLDYFLGQVRTLVKTKPPYNSAFTTQTLYLLNQAVTIMEGLHEVIRKQKLEIEKINLELVGIKPRKIITDPIRNAEIIKDFQSGATMLSIGKKHGITPSRVSQILLRLGVRNAGPPRVKGLSKSSNSDGQKPFDEREEARDPSDADGIGQDGNGGGSDRLGSGEGQAGDLHGSGDHPYHADNRELQT